MHFDFTDDQHALAQAARDMFAGRFTTEHLRVCWDRRDGHDAEHWSELGAMGLLGLLVPEDHGGMGMTDVEAVLVLEQAGYAGVPEPLLDAIVAGPLLAAARNAELRDRWLPRLATGDALVALQLDGGPFVVAADHADVLLTRLDEDCVAVPGDRLRLERQVSMDHSRAVFSVEFDAADAVPLEAPVEAVQAAWDRAVASTAALMNGVSWRMFDMSLTYAKEREQFGRVIGSFQAIKHKLADMWTLVDTVRPTSWYAAYSLAKRLEDQAQAASVAKAAAGRVERQVNREALQCHGGIGFTWEHDLHLWMKRGVALEHSYGQAEVHEDRLAEGFFAGEVADGPAIFD